MYLKDITDNDMYHFWPQDDVVPGMNLIHRLIDPTPEVVELNLGHKHPVISMTLCDDAHRSPSKILNNYFMTYGTDCVHMSHSDDRITYIAGHLELDLQVLPNHPELVEGDYWYGSKKPFARFTVEGFLCYLNESYRTGGFFIDPEPYVDPPGFSDEPGVPCKGATRITHSIFAPERKDIDDINAMSFILHGGFFDCEETDKDKAEELGIDNLRNIRKATSNAAIV